MNDPNIPSGPTGSSDAAAGLLDAPPPFPAATGSDGAPFAPPPSSAKPPGMLFADLGLKPEVLKALEDMGFQRAMDVQAATIPAMVKLTPNVGDISVIGKAAVKGGADALSLINTLVVAVLPPRLLPKLDFEDGVPEEHRTLVVVPSLLESRKGIAQLLEDLEVRALANTGENLYFALVTDFVDCAHQTRGAAFDLFTHTIGSAVSTSLAQ